MPAEHLIMWGVVERIFYRALEEIGNVTFSTSDSDTWALVIRDIVICDIDIYINYTCVYVYVIFYIFLLSKWYEIK